MRWDLFLSHASEDKEGLARPLARSLEDLGLRVWFDELSLKPGASLRRSIDQGLRASRYAVVVISPAFLRGEWPQRELDALFQLEEQVGERILVIWHRVGDARVRDAMPMLADRVALKSSIGIRDLAQRLEERVRELDEERIGALLEESRLLVESHEWKKAEQSLDRARQLDPHRPETLLALTDVLVKLDRMDEALLLIEQLEARERSARLSHARGCAYLEQGRNAEAQTSLQEALDGDRGNDQIRILLAKSLLYQGKYEEALATFRAAERATVEILRAEAWLLQKLGRKGEEIAVRERLAARDGATAEDLVELGEAHEWCGSTQEALNLYQRAMLIDAESEGLWRFASLLINRSGLDALPITWQLLYRVGCEAQTRGWRYIAKQLFGRVLASQPRHEPSLRELSKITQDQGLLDESLRLAVRAVDRPPLESQSYAQLARISAEIGHLPELPWNDAEQYLNLGKLWSVDEGIREVALRRALDLDPQNEEARTRLALCLRSQRKSEEAKAT